MRPILGISLVPFLLFWHICKFKEHAWPPDMDPAVKAAGIREAQDAGVREAQAAGVREAQDAGTREAQDAGVRETEDAGVRATESRSTIFPTAKIPQLFYLYTILN
ncbi:hypothetical protein Lbir_1150 [Legionella birminghamensis]|uniref:Uncharacterized protein n=2 Tax=Legionella birminghamensis TaxID=28083 RepID=A0ABR5QLV3_9GAMM|nr:hypothetical protein Lbir_1150 [Legionella birminghamensis]